MRRPRGPRRAIIVATWRYPSLSKNIFQKAKLRGQMPISIHVPRGCRVSRAVFRRMTGIARARTAWLKKPQKPAAAVDFQNYTRMDGIVFRSRARRSRIADLWCKEGSRRRAAGTPDSTTHARDRAAQGLARDRDGLGREIMLEDMSCEGVLVRALVLAEVLFGGEGSLGRCLCQGTERSRGLGARPSRPGLPTFLIQTYITC
jgi:hypothetical protein